jgi:hypothetical protein
VEDFVVPELPVYRPFCPLISKLFNNTIEYIYKPIKNDNDIIEPMPKDFKFDINELTSKNNLYISKNDIEKGALSIAKKISHNLKHILNILMKYFTV